MICIAAVWLASSFPVTPPSSSIASSTGASSPITAPALSPFFAPTPSIPADKRGADSTTPEVIAEEELPADYSTPLRSSNWNVISYPEALANSDQEESQARPSLRISIPSLGIDAPVESVSLTEMKNGNGKSFWQWSVPDRYAVGWHDTSASPGQPGNTVINGHNNIYGAVFKDLVDLTLGEEIILYDQDQQHVYQVVHREFLLERGESLRTRLRNARWIAQSDDDRLTIVTCWPNTTNSHRLVVIAQPLSPGY